MNSNAARPGAMSSRGIAGTFGAAALTPFAVRAAAECGDRYTAFRHHQPAAAMGASRAADIYPDPDVIVIDPSFTALRMGNAAIHRVATGFRGRKDRPGRTRASTSCSAMWWATRSIGCCGTTEV